MLFLVETVELDEGFYGDGTTITKSDDEIALPAELQLEDKNKRVSGFANVHSRKWTSVRILNP